MVVWVMVSLLAMIWWGVHAWRWDVKYWMKSRRRRALPPGSMGWPLLGESLHLLHSSSSSSSSSLKPARFFQQRQTRFGPIYKSHLFGEPVVVSTSSTINAFVLLKEGELFKSAYPASFVAMMGKFSLMAAHGPLHAQLRRQIMCITGSASLPHYVSEIEENVLACLSTWEDAPIIFLHKEARMMSFDLLVKRLIGLSTKDDKVQTMMQCFDKFIAALISLPINLLGTSFNVGLKGRAKVVQILEGIILQRTKSLPPSHHAEGYINDSPPKDLLDALLQEEKRDSKVYTRSLTLDVMVGVIYAAYETTATALTFVVMLLTKHPHVVQKLMVEHTGIKSKKASNNKKLTWEDYKSMSYTKDVIYETLRLANVAPFVYREALQDVEIGGYIIPKGWKVITSLSSPHIDSTNYTFPFDFNPSRWQDDPVSTKSFMPFGGGSRLCAGNELTLLQISIFLHHFLTNYEWSELKEEQVIRYPGIKFKYGYPIKIIKKMQ